MKGQIKFIHIDDRYIISIVDKVLTIYKNTGEDDKFYNYPVIYTTNNFTHTVKKVGEVVIREAGVCLHDGPYATTKYIDKKDTKIDCSFFYFHEDGDHNRKLIIK
jgi:hypothetical protein